MNFKDIIKINIPEGSVSKITDSNGVVIWKYYPSLPELTDDPKLPEPLGNRLHYISSDNEVINIDSDYIVSNKYENDLGTIAFDSGIASIPSYLFLDCTKLRQVKFPEGVNTISSGAFANTGIKFLSFPNSLEYINTQAFAECNRLTTLVIDENIKSIQRAAFYLCGHLGLIICKAKTAPTIYSGVNTFFATFEGVGAFLEGEKFLYVPKGSKGYEQGEWKKQLLDKGYQLIYYR